MPGKPRVGAQLVEVERPGVDVEPRRGELLGGAMLQVGLSASVPVMLGTRTRSIEVVDERLLVERVDERAPRGPSTRSPAERSADRR